MPPELHCSVYGERVVRAGYWVLTGSVASTLHARINWLLQLLCTPPSRPIEHLYLFVLEVPQDQDLN